MTKRASTLVLLATSLCFAECIHAQGRRNRESATLENYTARSESFESASLDQDVDYQVFLPKGWDAKPKDGAEAKTYPLVIWLHGLFRDHRRFNNPKGIGTVDQMVGSGELSEMIVVSPDGGRSFYINGKETGDFETMITKDLIAHMEKNFPVAKDRAHRAIMGISMGGLGALKIGMKNPEMFIAAAGHSAALLPPNPDDLPPRIKGFAPRLGIYEIFGEPIDKKMWQAENPLFLASQMKPADLKGLSLYFDAGTRDRYEFHKTNTALHQLLTKAKIPHEWALIEDGGHAWGSGFKASSIEASFAAVNTAMEREAAKDRGKAGLQGLMGGKKDTASQPSPSQPSSSAPSKGKDNDGGGGR